VPLTGLFYGGGAGVLKAQMVGSLIITVATFSVALAVMYLIKAAGVLRVSAAGEAYGLDLHEHGISAYPEYVISAMGRPAGMAHMELPKSTKHTPAQLSTIEPTV
jgi:Amt family ammonium transporter